MNQVRKRKLFGKLPFVAVLFGLLVPHSLWAEDVEKVNIPGNIGFIQNPPQVLTDRFPMCDAFLQVDWISKEKRIGQSHFELYKDGEKIGVMDALVYLSDTVLKARLSLYEIIRDGELEKLKVALRKGTIKSSKIPVVTYNSYKKLLHSYHISADGYTYSDNRQNVCVVYPDHERVWLAEGKKVGKVYSQNEIDEKYKVVSMSVPKLAKKWFEDMSVVDINFDDTEDYVKGRSFIYSLNDKYFQKKREKVFFRHPTNVSLWSFPPKEKKCEVILKYGYHITYDGNNYLFSNQCNLTELTTGEY